MPDPVAKLLGTAVFVVDNNTGFYEDEISKTMINDIVNFANYIDAVTKARKEAQEVGPLQKASQLPTWDHDNPEGRQMLHGIQSVNIWLIDYCIASHVQLSKKHDYTKMVAIYVGKLPWYMLGRHSTNTNSFFFH